MEIIEKIKESVIAGEEEQLVGLVRKAYESGIEVSVIVQDGLIEAMNIIGPKMASGEMFVPEVLLSAETMRAGLEVVKPYLSAGDVSTLGKVVIGTVEGDLHDIGKNMVAMMLESSGFEVVNLGTDLTPEDFLKAVEDNKPDIVGLSALLTTTMPAMRKTVALLKEKAAGVKIMVGGAPVNDAFAGEIGADGYAPDAAGAVQLAKQLMA